MKEGHSEGYNKLSEQTTLAEVLEVAASFEKVAYDFYSSMSPKVSEKLRHILEELAEEEEVHYNTFAGLKADPEVLKQLHEKLQKTAEDHNFSDFTHQPEFKENFDDKAILEYALSREDSAMKQYQQLADNAPEGPLKSVFQFLAYEETEHKKELEKKYNELINQSE